jgi:3-hydroxyacyl-[acyl-carrier-protein] dehydratase
MGSEVSINKLYDLLLHRYPFLLIDRVLDYSEGESIHAIKNVSINEPFFVGHFPDKPVMPGVLMIESMAQAAGALWALSKPGEVKVIPLLAGVDQVRFRRIVTPGDQLHIYLAIEKQRKNMARFDSRIEVNGEEVCSAKLLIAQGV